MRQDRELSVTTVAARPALRAEDIRPALRAGDVFAALCFAAIANGCLARIVAAVASEGPAAAALDLFGISAITWLGFAAALHALRRELPQPLSRTDAAAATLLLCCILFPAGALSWIGLTGFAVFLLGRPGGRDAGWLLLALAANMAWGRWLLVLVGTPVLAVDAWLVATLTGALQSGNTVGGADDGFVFIAPACSSVSNLSLAVVASAICSRSLRLYDGRAALLRAGLAAAATIAINVGRIGALVTWPGAYDWLHDGGGATLGGWLTTLVVAAIFLCGTRHAPRPRA